MSISALRFMGSVVGALGSSPTIPWERLSGLVVAGLVALLFCKSVEVAGLEILAESRAKKKDEGKDCSDLFEKDVGIMDEL